MTIPQIISLVILLIVIFLALKKGSDMFSPGKTFLGVWSLCIFLTEFKFSGFQHQWSLYSWIVFLLGLATFLLGVFAAYVIFIDKPILSVKFLRERSLKFDIKNLNNLYYSILVLFLLYVIAYGIEVTVRNGVPIFNYRPDDAKNEFAVFGIHLFVTSQLSIMVLCVEYLVLKNSAKIIARKKIVVAIFIFTVLSYALLLQRFSYFFGGLIMLAFLYYASNTLKFKWILTMSVVFFSFLGFLQSIRLSKYVSQYIYMISKVRYSKDYALFTEPYMYITMNLENMARAIDQLKYHVYGSQTFDWIYAVSGLKHWIADYFHIDHRNFLISGYTTFPFHWYYYWDFGMIGVTFFPLILGFGIGMCYYMMRLTAQLLWIILYSIGFAVIGISFFTNPLMLLNLVSNIFILCFIHYFFVTKDFNVHEIIR